MSKAEYLYRAARKTDRITGRIDRGVQIVIALTLGVIAVMMITQVSFRYVIRSPIIWIEEGAGFLLGYVALWGASCCLRTGKHISVQFIRKKFPMTTQRLFAVGGFLIIAFLAYFMITSGYEFAMRVAGQLTESGTFDPSHARLAIPTGGVLILLQAVNCIIQEIRGMVTDRTGPEPLPVQTG